MTTQVENKKVNRRQLYIGMLCGIVIFFIAWIIYSYLPFFNPPEKMTDYVAEAETKTIQVDDINIAYKDFGSGEPLIMIMGFSGTMDLWDTDVLNAIASNYRLIIFDNRGMGETSSSDKEYTIPQFADDTAGLMEVLNIDKANILGWSMGTYVAQELAINYPDKVGKLILYAADPGSDHLIDQKPEGLALVTDTSGTEEERDERLLRALFPEEWLEENPDPSTYLPAIEETTPDDIINRHAEAMDVWQGSYDRSPNIKSETLLIAGTEDIIPPPSNSYLIAEQIPDASVILIKGGGHGVMYQYPKKFSDYILSFLKNNS